MAEWEYGSMNMHGNEWLVSRHGRLTPGLELPIPTGKKRRWSPENVRTDNNCRNNNQIVSWSSEHRETNSAPRFRASKGRHQEIELEGSSVKTTPSLKTQCNLIHYVSLTECNSGTIEKLPILS